MIFKNLPRSVWVDRRVILDISETWMADGMGVRSKSWSGCAGGCLNGGWDHLEHSAYGAGVKAGPPLSPLDYLL